MSAKPSRRQMMILSLIEKGYMVGIDQVFAKFCENFFFYEPHISTDVLEKLARSLDPKIDPKKDRDTYVSALHKILNADKMIKSLDEDDFPELFEMSEAQDELLQTCFLVKYLSTQYIKRIVIVLKLQLAKKRDLSNVDEEVARDYIEYYLHQLEKFNKAITKSFE